MSLLKKLIKLRFLAAMLSCFLIAFTNAALTADWQISKQLTTQGTYTDNLELNNTKIVANDKKSKSDFFIDITPGLVVTGKGRRLNFDFAYSPQYLHYFSATSDDQVNHRLQLNTQAELYKEHLFFDFNVTAQQEIIDSLGPSSGDSINPTGNTQTTYTYQITPSYKNRFGRFVNLDIRFENNGVFYSDQGSNSVGYRSQIELSNGSALTALRWGINAENERSEFEKNTGVENVLIQEQPTTERNNIGVLLGYQFSKRWQMMTQFGYEKNNYVALNETNGENWKFSNTWTPTARTTFQLGADYRYFGWSPILELTHRHKHSAWTASFSRDISSARNERLQNKVYAFKDAFGETVVPDTGDRLAVRPNTAIPISSTFISSQFQMGYAFQMRRNTIGSTLRYTLREYAETGQNDETLGASLFLTHKLTGLTSSHLSLSWDQNKRDSGVNFIQPTLITQSTLANEVTNFTIDTGLSHQLSAHTNLDLQYRFLDSDQYTENRVTLGLRMMWSN
ncbi:TIGR03016 family PEP-CTERM system-associated outer membrane protein [Chromatium weissei]|nr:TIGR03016 family PEP-CTERM system-associated outer membrane protein [Chromatium weissei]